MRVLYFFIIFLLSFLLLSNSTALEFLNLALSENGTRVAVLTFTNISVYDVYTGESISVFTEPRTAEKGEDALMRGAGPLTFSTDARSIASSHRNRIYIWETATGSLIGMLDDHPSKIKVLTLSPDNTILATASEDWRVRLWHINTGCYLGSLEHPSAVNALAFSPDGKILASAGADIHLWDMTTHKRLYI